MSVYLAGRLKENKWNLAEISLYLLGLGDFISSSPLCVPYFLSQVILAEKSFESFKVYFPPQYRTSQVCVKMSFGLCFQLCTSLPWFAWSVIAILRRGKKKQTCHSWPARVPTGDEYNPEAGINPSGLWAFQHIVWLWSTAARGSSREEDGSETVLVVNRRNFFLHLFEMEAGVHTSSH